MKKTEKDTNRCKDILCLWIGRILLKCPHYRRQSANSMQSLQKAMAELKRNNP